MPIAFFFSSTRHQRRSREGGTIETQPSYDAICALYHDGFPCTAAARKRSPPAARPAFDEPLAFARWEASSSRQASEIRWSQATQPGLHTDCCVAPRGSKTGFNCRTRPRGRAERRGPRALRQAAIGVCASARGAANVDPDARAASNEATRRSTWPKRMKTFRQCDRTK